MVGWQSSVNGPIPPHPIYDTKDRSMYSVTPPLRVKGEGEKIALKGHKGCIGNLMTDEIAIDGMGIGPRQKKMPKDHIRENVKRMRQIQRASHMKTDEQHTNSPQPVKALWKSDKFSNVPSKVAEALQPGNMTPRPQSRDYLRAHSRSGPSRPVSRGPSPQLRLSSSQDNISVPTAKEAKSVQMARNDFDFIKINGINARYSAVKRSPSETALDEVKHRQEAELKTYRRGVVPQYLIERRKQWGKDEEERKAAEPDPDCPPGHRMMTEKERRETLDILQSQYKALIRALQEIPITSDTLRTKNKRRETEQKLEEVEEAVRIFTKPKVFVKIDQ